MDQRERKDESDLFKNITIISTEPLSVDTEEFETPFKRTKTMSKVWDVFEKLPVLPNGDIKAMCKSCKKVYSAKPSGGTSHLKRHMEACVKRVNHAIKEYTYSPDTLTDATTSLKNAKFDLDEIKNAKFDLDEIRRALTVMIVLDGKPLRMVENVGFRGLMAVACPELQMMSVRNIKKDIMSMYAMEKENVCALLATCPGRICLSSCRWKSSTDDYYNCVTANFIDHEWKLQKRILRFKLVPPPYDSLSIGDEITSCMVQWNIEHKVFSITLDCLSVDDCVASILKARFDAKKYLPCNGVFFNVRCFAQIMNSIVQAGFDIIKEIIRKLRLGVKYVKQSPHRKKNFYIIAKNLNLDTREKLCIDCPSSWDSVYRMLEIAFHYKRAFLYLGEQDRNFIYTLSEHEWEKVSILCRFLKVFYEVAHMFSGNRYPTANLYFKGVWKIHRNLLEVVTGPENFMTSMVKEMLLKFTEYWSECSLILSCAAILDPRYKVKFIEYCYTKLYGSDAQQYIHTIVDSLHRLFNEYSKNSSSISSIGAGPAVTTNVSCDGYYSDGFEDYKTFQSASFQTQVQRSELDLYLEEPSHDLNSEIDVLEYWRSCSAKCPELSKMARDILTIPISTIASNSVFNLCCPVINPCRNSLNEKTIQALVCLQDWLQPYGRAGQSGYLESLADDDCSSSNDGDDDDDTD